MNGNNTQDQTRLQLYEQIQAMVKKDAADVARQVYEEEAAKYGVAKVPLHRHNGYDSPKISAWDIIPSQGSSGSITMATNGTRYRIGLNLKSGVSFAPTQIRFNGIAIHQTAGTTDIRALVCGDAFIGPSFYQQPGTATSTKVGGPPQVCVQSSSYILVNNSGSGPATQALASEGHIVSVTFNSVIVARATIPDLGDFGASDTGPLEGGNLLVDVTLSSGWQIIGNWQVQ